MENLIKTKKLETRFFLNQANNQPINANINHNKPSTSHSKNKERRDILNTTAPINLHMGYMNQGIGLSANNTSATPSSTKNSSMRNQNSNLNQTQQINLNNTTDNSFGGTSNGGGFSFYPSRLSHQMNNMNGSAIHSQKH